MKYQAWDWPMEPPTQPKPPLGIIRRDIWERHCLETRREDIIAAMRRYSQAQKAIPVEWVDELDQLGGAA